MGKLLLPHTPPWLRTETQWESQSSKSLSKCQKVLPLSKQICFFMKNPRSQKPWHLPSVLMHVLPSFCCSRFLWFCFPVHLLVCIVAGNRKPVAEARDTVIFSTSHRTGKTSPGPGSQVPLTTARQAFSRLIHHMRCQLFTWHLWKGVLTFIF